MMAALDCEIFETWMGDKNSSDRVFIRERWGKFDTFLDAGCGACPEYYGLMEKFPHIKYTGLDITPKLVEYNLNKNINCVEGSINNIPFDDNSFDVTLSRHVVEHMSNIETPLSELIRVTKNKIILCFFIDPMDNMTDEHIMCLDNEGTSGEVYHNKYSKNIIDNLLIEEFKVEDSTWVALGGMGSSVSLLEINLVDTH
jgi:ubiquinone/menaquinone biosynthesis C-methylase UbiE